MSVLWLLPFFPTPNRDDGYDITAYDAVDRRLGTLGQFVEVIRTAKDRGMRVIIDLVLNHTSDQHPRLAVRSTMQWSDHSGGGFGPPEARPPSSELAGGRS